MADPISGAAHAAFAQGLGQEKLQQQAGTGGRSFETVLQQQPNGGTQGGGPAAEQPAGVSGADLERMRLDLEGRISRLPPGSPGINALLPELIDTRTRMGMLRDVMGQARGNPVGTNLQGRFGQIEHEWGQVESIMRSNKDLSTTELLGLQARLYQVTQHVEVLSKVVDQVTGGIKTILNTNV
jgi:hypothetical protein